MYAQDQKEAAQDRWRDHGLADANSTLTSIDADYYEV